MKSLVSTAPGRQDHPPQPNPPLLATRRVSAVDRLALHLGVALIKWGRRPLSMESRERRASRIEQSLARAARESETERRWILTAPLR
jgi:hypothetical protein